MKTKDQILKIKAAVLYILKQMPEGADYMHLYKIMYFAQQAHLVKYGLPIMEDTFCAKQHGPVPTITNKVLHGIVDNTVFEEEALVDFSKAISFSQEGGYPIFKSLEEFDEDELSISNINALQEAIENYGHLESFELSELSHDTAWSKANRNSAQTGSKTNISLYEIAKAGGATKDMLNIIRERQSILTSLS